MSQISINVWNPRPWNSDLVRKSRQDYQVDRRHDSQGAIGSNAKPLQVGDPFRRHKYVPPRELQNVIIMINDFDLQSVMIAN